MKESMIFTSESVTKGHPDKVCDQIADGILDAVLQKDPNAHVACEVTVIQDEVHIFGEISAKEMCDVEAVAREVIKGIGYTEKGRGFDYETCRIRVDLHEQSADIAQGIRKDNALENGAGDQGIMFGYACNETEQLMPLPIELAHKLTKRLAYVREMCILPYLLPDGKAQVSVEYIKGRPTRISAIVLSAQHKEDVPLTQIQTDLIDHVIEAVIPQELIDQNTNILINPSGRFVLGGPAADSGLTGRKLIVDSYGGMARHGGGAFSGKDPSKVDRSAAYMARFIAKNIVAAKLAEKCEVQLGYAIGVAEPVSFAIDTFNTGRLSADEIKAIVEKDLDLRPEAIIARLELRTPFYHCVSSGGHFGSNAEEMPWEQTPYASLWQIK